MLKEKKEAKLGVEELEATSFFSDIVGFTSITESVPPADLVMVLKEYFNAMTSAVNSRFGVIGDYIGDAIFALFGSPLQVSRHAYLACDAAIEQQNMLMVLRRSWANRNLPPIHIRIGIATGEVLAGQVGSDSRLKFTFMGDSVNLASRLEALGKYYGVGIIVSGFTYKQAGVKESFVFQALDIVRVVGKHQNVLILALLSRREDSCPNELLLERYSMEALDCIKKRNFEQALEYYKAMMRLVIDGNTLAVEIMMKRVEELIACQDQLPEDWDYFHQMSSK